jgi:hypothetical protein
LSSPFPSSGREKTFSDQHFLDEVGRVEQDDIDASETRSADARNLRAESFQHADAAAEKRAEGLDQARHNTMLAVLALGHGDHHDPRPR